MVQNAERNPTDRTPAERTLTIPAEALTPRAMRVLNENFLPALDQPHRTAVDQQIRAWSDQGGQQQGGQRGALRTEGESPR
jgi:hypothetical protein